MDPLAFRLPSDSTWVAVCAALVGAVLFQFTRLVTLRNLDLIGLFLFAPGFLLIRAAEDSPPRDPVRTLGYGWLLAAAAVWAVRCLLDLTVSRRPVLKTNLTLPALSFLTVALFVGLTTATLMKPAGGDRPVGKTPAGIDGVKAGAAAVAAQAGAEDDSAAKEYAERGLSIAAHSAVALGLFFVGLFQYRDADTGLGMAAAYLLLPYTAFQFGQLHHVLPAALIVWAVYAFRRPWLSGLLLGLAAGSSFFPLLLLPAWVHFYWRRGTGRFFAGFGAAAVVGLALTLLAVWAAGGFHAGWAKPLHLADWQPWKVPTAEGLWTAVHWAYRLPVFIAFAVFAVGTFFWPPARNVGELIAVCAVLLIGVQFWYADRGGQYVLWYAPLLILMVFRPAAAELTPPESLSPFWATRWLRRTSFDATPPTVAA